MIEKTMWLAALFPLIATVSSIIRDNPRLPSPVGLRNWEFLQGRKFTPRHSHATAQFPCPNKTETCLWLTGGYSESHGSKENASADVWYSPDGAEWNQVVELGGDWLQGVGNHDAKRGGSYAPFYSRFGHSLNALDTDGDGVADAMILAGGYSPLPSNDVWISADGKNWFFDGFAPWPGRAHHGAVVFEDKLYILGGTPLSNDVWVGTLYRDATRRAGFRMDWRQEDSAQWSPRAGHCVVAKNSTAAVPNATDAEVSFSEQLFVIGGISEGAGGRRTRSDVWTSLDGKSWEQVVTQSQGDDDHELPFGGRAFHGCAAFAAPSDHEGATPRLYLTGGGYYGDNMNRAVSVLEAYTDTWYSHDGVEWTQVNYEEGTIQEDNLFSTNEWTETLQNGRTIYRGKWGHTMEVLERQKSNCQTNGKECERASGESKMLLIGGKLEGGPIENAVYSSLSGGKRGAVTVIGTS